MSLGFPTHRVARKNFETTYFKIKKGEEYLDYGWGHIEKIKKELKE